MNDRMESNVTVLDRPVLDNEAYDALSAAAELSFDPTKIEDELDVDWGTKSREFIHALNQRGYTIVSIEDRDRE